jgi:hypothetical protein
MLPGDFIWSFVGFILTILVFSYLAGDNLLFRIVIYAFIGISAGYVTLILFSQVFWPRLVLPIITGSLTNKVVGVVGLIMSVLLALKLSPKLARLGNLPMGFLVGVGAAVAISGAVTGTLIPQFMASINLPYLQPAAHPQIYSWEPIVNGVLMVLGTLTILIYFQYGARQSRDGKIRRGWLIEILAWTGKVIVGISFGAIFAGVLSATITAMVERVAFLINFLRAMGG